MSTANMIDVAQGSADWLQAKCGCIGASRIREVNSTYKTKGRENEETAERRNYRIELVAERLTGLTTTKFVTYEMQRGIDMEKFARAAYEVRTGNIVEQAGFFLHPTIKYAGASPDGLVGNEGLLEIKCPLSATHIEYMLTAAEAIKNGKPALPPEEYQPQMLWQMACTGRKWCDFVSYDDRLPKKFQLFTVRFGRDDERIAQLEKAVIKFNDDIAATISKLQEVASE